MKTMVTLVTFLFASQIWAADTKAFFGEYVLDQANEACLNSLIVKSAELGNCKDGIYLEMTTPEKSEDLNTLMFCEINKGLQFEKTQTKLTPKPQVFATITEISMLFGNRLSNVHTKREYLNGIITQKEQTTNTLVKNKDSITLYYKHQIFKPYKMGPIPFKHESHQCVYKKNAAIDS